MGTTAWPRQQEQIYTPPVEHHVSQSPRHTPASFHGHLIMRPPQEQQGRHPVSICSYLVLLPPQVHRVDTQ